MIIERECWAGDEEKRLTVMVKCVNCGARVDLWESRPEPGVDTDGCRRMGYACHPACGARVSWAQGRKPGRPKKR